MGIDSQKLLAIMIMGRPGSGKDTQAKILASKMNLVRIATSDLLRKKFVEDAKNSEVKKEKEIFESGALNTPSWVIGVVKEYIQKLAKEDFKGKNGIIFSGSPRTPYEGKNLLSILEDSFGKQNIFAINLSVTDDLGLARIRKRNKKKSRILDTGEEKLKIRINEYYQKTKPTIDLLEEKGYVATVDGTLSIEKISEEIVKILGNKISEG